LDVSIEEIKNVLKILKPNKSPGEDGIISEFYITHWEQIKFKEISSWPFPFFRPFYSWANFCGFLFLCIIFLN
jgi:hypothetical protein